MGGYRATSSENYNFQTFLASISRGDVDFHLLAIISFYSFEQLVAFRHPKILFIDFEHEKANSLCRNRLNFYRPVADFIVLFESKH